MKSILKTFCIFLLVGCSSLNTNNMDDCNENLSFKKEFFNNIENVENYVDGTGDRLKFEKALTFLSKYVKVSRDKMLNYNHSYTSKKDFINDKKNWIEWYKKNKCNNLQLK